MSTPSDMPSHAEQRPPSRTRLGHADAHPPHGFKAVPNKDYKTKSEKWAGDAQVFTRVPLVKA